jgi:hypothetical protein
MIKYFILQSKIIASNLCYSMKCLKRCKEKERTSGWADSESFCGESRV